MAFEKAIQSLSFLEEKLRRAFNLAGPIGARLDPILTPVTLAGDVRDPGHSSFVGRSWAWSFDNGTPAGTSVLSMLFGADVLIEALYVTGEMGASQQIEAYVTTPTETIPLAATLAYGAWRDRKTVTADVPPILNGAAFAALTGTAITVGSRIQAWQGVTGASTRDAVREMKVMIPSGGTLTWRSTQAAALVRVGCWGRIWP